MIVRYLDVHKELFFLLKKLKFLYCYYQNLNLIININFVISKLIELYGETYFPSLLED